MVRMGHILLTKQYAKVRHWPDRTVADGLDRAPPTGNLCGNCVALSTERPKSNNPAGLPAGLP